MANSSKITFTDKVSTIVSSIPIINRIRAEDVNEIKSVVNSHADDIDTINSTISGLELDVQLTSDTNSLTLSGSSSNTGNKTMTKSGYYPVGIAGLNSDSNDVQLTGFYLSDVASGTCKVNYKFFNGNVSQKTSTISIYVMWIKI